MTSTQAKERDAARVRAFAGRLRTLLKLSGLSGRKLARATNLSPAAISRLINGQRRPSLGTLSRLANAFGITSTELWGD